MIVKKGQRWVRREKNELSFIQITNDAVECPWGRILAFVGEKINPEDKIGAVFSYIKIRDEAFQFDLETLFHKFANYGYAILPGQEAPEEVKE